MTIVGKKSCAGLALLLLALAGLWWLFHRRPSDRPPTADQLVAELRWEEPWHYRVLKRTHTLRFFPKRWFAQANDSQLDLSLRRWRAAMELGKLGTNAWPAVPALTAAVMHKNLDIAAAAAEALTLLKAESAPEWNTSQKVLTGQRAAARVFQWRLTGLNQFGQPSDLAHRRFGLIGLAATGPAAVVAHSDIVDLLKFSQEPELRSRGVIALGAMNSQTNTAPLLKSILQNQEEWPAVSAAAAQALAAALPGDLETRRLLQQALRDRRSHVSLAAARALWKLKAPPEEVLPVLNALLHHKLATIRTGALDGIAEMGSAASQSRALVEELLADENESVRRSARTALRSIGLKPHVF